MAIFLLVCTLVAGYNELMIIPAGATTITLRENDGRRSHLGQISF